MQLQMFAKHVELSPKIAELAERRLSFALGSLAARVGQVTLRLDDVNGPRGGVDQECRVEATVPRVGRINSHGTGLTAEAAIGRAADRMARQIRTELDSRRTKRLRGRQTARNLTE